MKLESTTLAWKNIDINNLYEIPNAPTPLLIIDINNLLHASCLQKSCYIGPNKKEGWHFSFIIMNQDTQQIKMSPYNVIKYMDISELIKAAEGDKNER